MSFLPLLLLLLIVIMSVVVTHGFVNSPSSSSLKQHNNKLKKRHFLRTPAARRASMVMMMTTDAALVQQARQRAIEQHEVEFAAGRKLFGSSSTSSIDNVDNNSPKENYWQFTNEDFRTHDIGRQNCGPLSASTSVDKALNGNTHYVFETIQPVLTADDCEFFIDAGRRAIAQGRQVDTAAKDEEEEATLTNSDLGEARLSDLHPGALQHLRHLLQTRLYPLLQSRFGNQDEFTLYDGLILGNMAPSKSQPVHRDASLLTLNIPLSAPPQFAGGGTYVEPLDDGFAAPLVIEQGQALCHLSGIRHAGTAITTGERWVLVVFLLARKEPQIARRCHAAGLQALDANDLSLAQASFVSGLQENPTDHLLLLGMGSIASRLGQRRQSYHYLAAATASYPLDRKAVLAKGTMLLAQKRPRAALRQFEQLLQHDIASRDNGTTVWMPLKALAWEARILAAQSCMLCADREAQQKQQQQQRTWTLAKLPLAVDWLLTALIPAPQDGRLHALLGRAQQLLAEAHQNA